MRELFGRVFGGGEEKEKKEEPRKFKVGDLVKHPFRDENVPILFIGSEVHTFVPRAYLDLYKAGRRVGTYDAIEGSPEFKKLDTDKRFVKQNPRRQTSAEIDLSNDLEERTLVVPLVDLKPADRD